MSLRLTPEQLNKYNELSHLPSMIARKMMGKRRHCHTEREDATQEGAMALAKAIRDYNPDCGRTIEQFAMYRVRARIIDAHRARFGRHQGTERFRFESSLVSTEQHVSGSNGRRQTSLGDVTPDSRAALDFVRADDADEIERMLRGLTPTQERVLRLYYCDDMKVDEIAKVIGKCQARCFQIICQAVNYLRRRSRTYEHVEGISRHTSAPVRMYRRLGVQRSDGTVLSLRQYADESGITLKRVHKLAASGRLNTVPIEEYDNADRGALCAALDHGGLAGGLCEQDAEESRCVAA